MSPRPQQPLAPYYEVEANRSGIFHTYRKRIEIRSVEDRSRAFDRAKKIAEAAAARGYNVRVYRHENNASGTYAITLELAAKILPPWGR